MHTVEAARGRGIGRAMVDRLVAVACERGYTRVSLETGAMEAFAAARSLYAAAGFEPCEPFGDYRPSRNSLFMTLRAGGEGATLVDYRRATEADRDAILRVLESANFHHVPSPEMPELDLERFFVAEVGGTIVGVAGFKVTSDGNGKTTLMAVEPAHR